MKKLTTRIVFLSALLFAVSLLLHFVVYPKFNLTEWSWGAPILHQKKIVLNESPDKYNLVVIGSSRVHRQVDPAILNSQIGTGNEIQAFNAGVNWLFAPESFYVFDHLKKENSGLKYAVIELSKIRTVDYSNLHTTRIIYWYSFRYFMFTIKAVWNSNFSLIEKINTTVVHVISYVDNLLNLGYFTEAFSFDSTIRYDNSLPDVGPAKNGFNPYIDSETNSVTNDRDEPAGRYQKFLADTSVVTKRKQFSKQKFDRFESDPKLLNKYNEVYAKHLNNMIDNAARNGITLFFLLSPRIDLKQYDELIPLCHHIKPGHCIEISDSDKFPELYLASNSSDETHLNTKGAKIYSSILARKLDELIFQR